MKTLFAAISLLLLAASAQAQVTQAPVPLVNERVATLTWIDTSDNEDGFEIYMRKGDGSYEPRGKVGANVTSFQFTVVAAEGSGWCFAVLAFNHYGGQSVRSNDACGWQPLNAPEEPAATSIANAVTLRWKDNSNAETGYRIFRDNAERATVGANIATWTELVSSPPGTKHVYEVQPFSKNATGPRSNPAQVEVVIQISPPANPVLKF